jgi:hypothetical protein
MARKRNELPQLRLHKAKNRAYFQFRGRRYYTGPWESREPSPEAVATFRRTLAEMVLPAMERGEGPVPEAPRVPASDLLIADLVSDYEGFRRSPNAVIALATRSLDS